MNLRKEQVVFGVTVCAIGALIATSSSPKTPFSTAKSTKTALTYIERPAPDVARSLPATRDIAKLDRDIFSEPRDTRPLPPLDIEEPPLPPLSGLRPPPEPGVEAKVFGRFLRADATPTAVPGLFAEAAAGASASGDEDADTGALKELKQQSKKDAQKLSPDEVAAKDQSWKKLYDWVRINEGRPLFGYIRNDDRFGLHLDTSQPVLFVEVDPETGKEKLPGQPPVKFDRSRVLEFALADSVENRIQLHRREIGHSITPGQYASVLAFADECVQSRFEARRALEVAEEMYKLADSQSANGPEPKLGLARCYEAGFEFDKAFEVYQSMLDGSFAHRPEVHARLGELEARFRLFDSAEARFKEAERLGRADWSVQWSFGRFLCDRGRYDEAIEHLRTAYKVEPTNEQKEARSGIRFDLGRALLAHGEIAEARDYFAKSLQADDTNARARAGLAAADVLESKPGSGATATDKDQLSFDELYDRGLADLSAKNWTAARDELQLAASSDSLRANLAWRALSWLAELTGYPEDAFRWIEQANAADPTDPWTCYQRGRLLAGRDDVDGARDSFQKALDLELDFVDALVGLGELAMRKNDSDAAERYFARALELDPKRVEVHGLRGWNALYSSDLRGAEESFKRALQLAPGDSSASLGLAWCTYRKGTLEPALQQFADAEDSRRALPDDDPLKRYAHHQVERITDHASKVIWTDRFERRVLRNEWITEEQSGPTVTLADGQMVIAGTVTNGNAPTRAYKEWPPAVFYAVDMDVTIDHTTKARVGVFIAKERPNRTGPATTLGKVAIARHMESGLQVLTQDRSDTQEEYTEIAKVGGVEWWPTDRPVHVRLERIGEGSDAVGRIAIDGITVVEGFRMTALASTNQALRVGVFAEAATGRPVKVTVDNVEVIYKKDNK